MSSILLLSSLLKVRLAPRGARLASNAGESPHSSAISIVQEPLPSTRREGRRIGDETHILHASNSASSPREKNSEDFSEGPLFFLRGPGRSAKAPSSGKRRILHSRKQKASPSAKKKCANLRIGRVSPAKPAGKGCRFCRRSGRIALEQRGPVADLGLRPRALAASVEPLAPGRETVHTAASTDMWRCNNWSQAGHEIKSGSDG